MNAICSLSKIPVLQLASVCSLGSCRTNTSQLSHAEGDHHTSWWVFHAWSSGHRWRYFLSEQTIENRSSEVNWRQQILKLHFIHTPISCFKEVPSLRNGFTISSVTGKFGGSSEHLLITFGFIAFRNWNPKKSSSFQCCMTYSETHWQKIMFPILSVIIELLQMSTFS